MKRKTPSKKPKKSTPSANGNVMAWPDDPMSELKPIQRPVPDLSAQPLPTKIQGAAPAPAIYKAGTAQFRYWAAAEALRRGTDYWGAILPQGTSWQPGAVLPIFLDQGEDLNAYYDRVGLNFFHGGDTVVYSGESPDIVCHEMGHAILDSVRPQLWDAGSAEIAAFHESFGDMSALLSALQLEVVRTAVLTQTSGKLFRSSSLSRLAEQLGWAIRQVRADLVDPDCLRNAVNSFFYAAPDTLPPNGPASALSSEPHSFSRVFTAGFFGMLANMLAVSGAAPTEAQLKQVSVDAGKLLVDAVLASPVVPSYYSQVAGHLIESDKLMFNEKYKDAITNGFVKVGILSLHSVNAMMGAKAAPARQRLGLTASSGSGAARPALAVVQISGDEFGLTGQKLFVSGPSEDHRLPAAAASLMGESLPSLGHEAAARSFLEDLLQRGHVDFPSKVKSMAMGQHPTAKKTHEFVKADGGFQLTRRFFDCGFA